MASFSGNAFSYLFLVMLFSSSLIQARESKFFSKITHFSTTDFEPTELSLLSPIEAPAPSPFVVPLAPAPAPTSENGRSDLFTPAKEENEIFNQEFDGETYRYNNYNEKSSYNGNYNNNNNDNGYKLASESHETANQNNYNGYNVASESHETANQNNYNGFTGNYKYNNNGYELASDNGYETGNRNYNNNGYESNQQLGMSDTRYMAGGKYSYNAKNENYYNPANEYQVGKEIKTQNQAYYGNFENQNEFNNLQYENQESYDEQGSQEEESLP
ncbi:hypothetical protein JCGZ_25740 [Jatropha curcas]|uniref:Protein E6-like n=2 Tax=Jatropha curcas TaxID=180498 RepID=A0A067JMM0_JATCU|nr:hypothetical protein JCGZ_25740 [Jatropha curcas]